MTQKFIECSEVLGTCGWYVNTGIITGDQYGSRKRYVVKHNLITEVYLMTMQWKQLHVSACICHHQVV